jgi:hypothetical protein
MVMTDNFHPAVCPQCCRRAATRGAAVQTADWTGDAAFILREFLDLGAGALLNLCALVLFLLTFFDGKRRRLSLSQRQSLSELRLAQMDIADSQRQELQARQRILDRIAFSHDPATRPYAELDECDWALNKMAADYAALERTRLEIEYRK